MKLKYQEEINLTIRLEDVLAQAKKVKKSGTGYIMTCPAHTDNRPSLSASNSSDGKLLLYCHAGCSYENILQGFGLWQEVDLAPKASKVVAEYDYTDADGELVYQVIRLEPKSFRQRRPDGKGGWVYNLEGVQRTIYRLPYILQATTSVIIVEGERDADLLVSLGYNATTNSGGAGKWQKEFNKYFKGLDVIIIPDNDEAGFNHAEEVSKHIYFAASSVKIVHLDGLKDKEDLSDWLAKHETGDLDVLIDSVETLEYTEEDIQLDLTEPHDANAEFGIIGAVLKDNKHIAKVVESDVAKDFFIAKNRHVIQAMVDAFNEHENIDRITLSNRLNRSKKLKELNVLEYLKSIEENTPGNLNVDNWIHIVQSKSDFRKYVKIGKKLSTTVYTESEDVGKLGDSLTEDIFNIRRNDKKDGFSSIGETSYKVFHSARNLEQGEITGLATGFKVLDEITSGLQRTDLIIIAARPSMGKTGLAVNIATNVALQGGKVAFFSLEMSKEQLGQRIIAAEARINSQSFRNGNLDESDWVRMANVLPQLENAPLFIDDTAGITVNQLRVKARRLAAEQKRLDLIVVDYLQLMTGKGHEGRVQEVSQISRELKALAKEMDVPVIALSQLSRAPEARNPPKPMMSDLRESGCLVGRTNVFLPEFGKTKTIAELIGKKDFLVTSFNEKTGKYEQKVCTNVFSTGLKQVYKLETFNGKVLELTENHQLLTEEGWKPLKEITVGSKIHVPSTLASDTKTKYNTDKLAFLGLMLGDGKMLERNTPSFTNKDEDLITKFIELSTSIWGEKVRTKIYDCKTYKSVTLASNNQKTHVVGSVVTDYFKELGIWNKRAWEKFIPEEIKELGKKELAHFLKYLWATDGTISVMERKSRGKGVHNRDIEPFIVISYSTTSYKMANDVVDVLLRLGINSKISKTTKGNYRPNYNITVVGKASQYKFCKNVGIYGNRKTEKVKQALKYLKEKEEQYRFDTVRSITLGKVEEVFDLTVQDNHNFVANNVLVHNSIEQDADIVAFIYRPDYYQKENNDVKGLAEIIISKNRNGPTGVLDMAYIGRFTRFMDLIEV